MNNIEFTVGAELEFYLLDMEGKPIADLSSGKFPQKRFPIAKEYQVNLNHFYGSMADYTITPESGPAQFEVQFAPTSNAQQLAQNINQFKEYSHLAAGRAGLLISFDAKPVPNYCGSSLHIHYSSPLFDPWGLEANNGVMLIKRDEDNDYVLWAIGGMLEKMAADAHIFLPTEESRLRIEPWLNAPTKICWGRNNRSTAIRIPDAKPKRIEHRVSGADANPILVIEAVINAAEYGINKKIYPPEPIFGNAWEDKYVAEVL